MTLIVVLAHQIQRPGQLPSSDSRLNVSSSVQDFAFIWPRFAVVLLPSVAWWVSTQETAELWCDAAEIMKPHPDVGPSEGEAQDDLYLYS